MIGKKVIFGGIGSNPFSIFRHGVAGGMPLPSPEIPPPDSGKLSIDPATTCNNKELTWNNGGMKGNKEVNGYKLV